MASPDRLARHLPLSKHADGLPSSGGALSHPTAPMPTTCCWTNGRQPAMPPALTSTPPSFRPLSSPLRRRVPAVLCRVGAGKPAPAADEDGKKRPFFVDFGGKLTDQAKLMMPAFPSSVAGSLFAGGGRGRKEPQTVFVAGATGQVGVRIAQKLLRQGFTVRAGVPDLASAQELARLATAYGLISSAEARRLNAVESDFDDTEAIAKSIGSATKVVVTVGPAEKAPDSGVVTTDDALRVVQAADLAGVSNVVVVYDTEAAGGELGGGASASNVLDGFATFFSNLFSSRVQKMTLGEFLAKVVETDVKYTIVKASLTDDYSTESTYGLVLAKEGSASSSTTTTDTRKVSKLQIASLVADVFSNTEVAENKVVEVSTSSVATSKPIEEALTAIPEDSRRKEYQEAVSNAQAAAAAAAEEAAAMAAQRDADAEAPAGKSKAEGEKKKKNTSSEDAAASPVNEAQASLENLLSRARGLSTDFSWESFSAQLAAGSAAARSSGEEEAPKAQIATVRGQARAKKLAPQRAVVKPKVKQAVPAAKEVRPVFGGLFKQETIFVDED